MAGAQPEGIVQTTNPKGAAKAEVVRIIPWLWVRIPPVLSESMEWFVERQGRDPERRDLIDCVPLALPVPCEHPPSSLAKPVAHACREMRMSRNFGSAQATLETCTGPLS